VLLCAVHAVGFASESRSGSENTHALSFALAGQIQYFDFREFDNQGQELLQESGYLPGLSTGLLYRAGRVKLTTRADILDGRVDYQGQTQIGNPLETRTEEYLLSLEQSFMYQDRTDVPGLAGTGVGVFVGHTAWQRDIQPTAITRGLSERYQWWRAGITLDCPLPLLQSSVSNSPVRLSVSAFRTFSADVAVDLTKLGYGKPDLALGAKNGVKVALAYTPDLSDKWPLRLELDYQRWGFGRSDTKRLSNGAQTISILEPRSETEAVSVRLEWLFED